MSAGGAAADLAADQAPSHSCSRHCTLAGSGLSSPRLLAHDQRARAKVSVRPARAAPSSSTTLGRSPAPKNVTGAPRGNRPGPPRRSHLQDK
ncbi:hypothetical protein NDU88_000455 [Pleurodeles waltl]|uniref:Uncharacterized protein n=1 Tax=Pleurodeles waltl TaxID=8319 RepID=A0AAV7LIM5_PLEWA|nr:hypothetical protein NDU88_000455 [Pleurodeles waltl]